MDEHGALGAVARELNAGHYLWNGARRTWSAATVAVVVSGGAGSLLGRGGPLDRGRRSDVLDEWVATCCRFDGTRIESRTELQAILVEGGRVNHLLHAIVTLFVLGLWLPVWIVLTVRGRERRFAIRVDEHGSVILG
jgi:hypothetical protein